MTAPDTKSVAVEATQEDRDAAAHLLRMLELHFYADEVATGDADYSAATQAFVKTRLLARRSAMIEAAGIAEKHKTNGRRLYGLRGRYDQAAEEIAAALRQAAEASPNPDQARDGSGKGEG